ERSRSGAFLTPKGSDSIARGNAPGSRVLVLQPEGLRHAGASLPEVPLVERLAGLAHQVAHLVLKRLRTVVLLLPADVRDHPRLVGGADRERAVAGLPVEPRMHLRLRPLRRLLL